MSFTPDWEVVPGEVATAAKMSQLGANDDYLKDEMESVAPVGAIIGYAKASAPAGWLLCDGSPVSRSTYADLFIEIGTSFGAGNGTDTFNVPDLRGRVMVGRKTGDTNFDSMGEVGGLTQVTLSANEMPAHSHYVNDPGHSHYYIEPQHPITVQGIHSNDTPLGHVPSRYGSGTGGAHTGIWLSNAGGGAAHTNLQPYTTVNHIIKY